MEVTLLGTAAPEGLPRPGCPCAACALARGEDARAATAVMVDGVLLLDLTPGLTFSAARAGHWLGGVRQVLLSHPHEGPPAQAPAGLPRPGRVPDGRELTLLTGHRVRAVAVDAPGTGYEVVGPDGARLLYLPPAAAPAGLPAHQEPYDLVLADVLGRPDALARLRTSGGVAAATDVVAVHIGGGDRVGDHGVPDHDVPPGPELRRRLAAAGARVLADGARVGAGAYGSSNGGTGQGSPTVAGVAALPYVPDVPVVPRRTLVLGGARSGKSVEAERRLAAFPDVLYVATGGARDGDPEWTERVGAHRRRRPGTWRTVETCDLVPLLDAEHAAESGGTAAGRGGTDGGGTGVEEGAAAERDAGTAAGAAGAAAGGGTALLIDCLSLWLTAMMDEVGAWDDAGWAAGGERELRRRVAALTAAVRRTRRMVVAVSNEVGSGIVPATASGRRYRDELGRLNAAFATECEQVLLVVAGQTVVLR